MIRQLLSFLLLLPLFPLFGGNVTGGNAATFEAFNSQVNSKLNGWKSSFEGGYSRFSSSVNSKLDGFNSKSSSILNSFQNSVNSKFAAFDAGFGNAYATANKSVNNGGSKESAGSQLKSSLATESQKLKNGLKDARTDAESQLKNDASSNGENIDNECNQLDDDMENLDEDIDEDTNELNSSSNDSNPATPAPPAPGGCVAVEWGNIMAESSNGGWIWAYSSIPCTGLFRVHFDTDIVQDPISPSAPFIRVAIGNPSPDTPCWSSNNVGNDGVFEIPANAKKPYWVSAWGGYGYYMHSGDTEVEDRNTWKLVPISTVLGSSRFHGNHVSYIQYLGPAGTDPDSIPNPSGSGSGGSGGNNPKSDTGTNSDETSSGDPSDDPLTDVSTGVENLDKIWAKIRPNFSSMNPSGTSDYTLHVPLNTSVGDFSFDIGGWSTVCGGSLDTFRSLLRGISKFIFSCVFVFGLVYTFRQW